MAQSITAMHQSNKPPQTTAPAWEAVQETQAEASMSASCRRDDIVSAVLTAYNDDMVM